MKALKLNPATRLFLAIALLAALSSAMPSRLDARRATLAVTNTDDSGPGSLRQTIADANPGDTITFEVDGVATIELGSVLTIDKDLTIIGPARINGAGSTQLFSIDPGNSVVLSGLTFRNGSADFGGAIVNLGSLTITDSTFTENVAQFDGGALYNNGAAEIRNSTFSGNGGTLGWGGAISNQVGATLAMLHVTVVENQASVMGGGVANYGDATVTNSIIAGNDSGDGTQLYTDSGAVSTLAFNILSGDPLLGPLQNNGGLTETHMPLIGSPALDAADNDATNNAGLTTDQRGLGFARIVDGPDPDVIATADIGAVEMESPLEDVADIVGIEDTPFGLVFSIPDEFDLITVTSSDTAVVPNGNLGVSFDTPGNRLLTITPAPNAFGSTTITITATSTTIPSTVADTFLATFTPVADTPSVTDATTLAEVQTTSGLVIARNIADGVEVTHFKITGITNGTLYQHDGVTQIFDDTFITFAEGNDGLAFTPDPGGTATGSFDVQAALADDDAALGGAVVTATITVDKHVTTTTITSHDPNPSEQGSLAGVLVEFTVAATTGPTPTGTVTVSAGPGEECTQDVDVGSCFIDLLVAGVDRTLTATYSGDDLSLESIGTALHTVTPCDDYTTVTTNADSGPGSFRQALLDTCSMGEIDFDMSSVVSPITLTSGELVLAKLVEITGPGAEQLTIQRSSGTFRLMRIEPEVLALISGLTLANGDATTSVGGGGAIYNDGGLIDLFAIDFTGNTAGSGGALANSTTLPSATFISSSTFRGNSSTGAGGAIANTIPLGLFGGVALYQSTISGNTAGTDGGGIYNIGYLELVHDTIANNRADSDGDGSGTGGGVWADPADGVVVVGNSIVAGNVSNTVPDDFVASDVEAALSNVIGVDTNGVILNDGSNFIGTPASPVDARLAPLANNGGPTLTHALLPGSPALDSGDNEITEATLCECDGDQRGPAFERLRTAAGGDVDEPRADMGAIEADPTVEDIGDKTTLENTPLSFSFAVGDETTAFTSIVATSSNQALVPDANFDVTGSGGSRTLAITPAIHQAGTATITVTATKTIAGFAVSSADTFVLTVDAINDAPTLDPIGDVVIAEDSGLQTIVLTGISPGPSESQALGLTAVSSNPSVVPHPLIVYSGTGSTGLLSFTPVANASGPAVITVTLQDNGGTALGGSDTVVRTFNVAVTPVADTPSITNATTPVNAQTTSGLVVSRNAVDGVEVTHVKVLSIVNGTLFQANGLTPIAAGSFITMAEGGAGLRFTPQADSSATGQVTIQASVGSTDAGLGGALVTADITVTRLVSTTSVTTSLTPSAARRNVTFTATVTPLTAGTVQFRDGVAALGAPVALTGGTASFTTLALPAGTHHITAEFTGTSVYLGSTGAVDQVVIGGRTITTGAHSGNNTDVRRFEALDGLPVDGPTAHFFAAGFTGGVRVAEADMNGDGTPDIIAASGPGSAPRVVVFDGVSGAIVSDNLVGSASDQSGVFIAAGDVDGDGRPDLVTGAGSGSVVRVFSGASGAPIWTAIVFAPSFTGGVHVAAGDVDGDGFADIITGSGAGDPSMVRVFSGAATHAELQSFAPYPGFLGGVWVASGDVNGDGYDDVITGAGAGGGPHVRVFDGRTGAAGFQFFVPGGGLGGVRIAAGDVNGDGRADIITTPGPGGDGVTRIFDGLSGAPAGTPIVPALGDTGGHFVSTAILENRMVIDTPVAGATVSDTFRLSGWVFEEGASDTGVDAVDVWAFPVTGGAATFLGGATLGDLRPDVAAIFGARYEPSGYHLDVTGLAAGQYDVALYARSSVSGRFGTSRVVRVRVVPAGTDLRIGLDLPRAGRVSPRFRVAGFAFDAGLTGPGTGIDAVDVWVAPTGGTPIYLGPATLGDSRPDLANPLSGFHLDVPDLAPGGYLLAVFARATGRLTFADPHVVSITVAPWEPALQMRIDLPTTGAVTPGGFQIGGWALVTDGPTTPGVDAVHVWAYPVGGGAPRFVGAALLGGARPDVASIFGPGYENTGFNLFVTDLPAGTWDLAVFARMTGASGFSAAQTVRIVVP